MRFNSLWTVVLMVASLAACSRTESVGGGVARTGASDESGLKELEGAAWSAEVAAQYPPMMLAGDIVVQTKNSVVPVSKGETGTAIKLSKGPTTAVTAVSGRLYYGAGKAVVAAAKDSGEVIWSTRTAKAVEREPAVFGELVFVGAGPLVALSAETGEERWSFKGDGDFESVPSIAGDVVFGADSAGNVYAIDAHSGQQVWKTETDHSFGGMAVAVLNDMLVVPAPEGVIWGLWSATGRERWRFSTGGVISTDVALNGRRAFAGNEQGEVFAIGLKTGQLVWRVEELAAVTASPVWAGGKVYIGTDDGALTAFDAKSGAQSWTFKLGDEPLGAPLIGSGVVWVTDASGKLYELK